jgi:hypothetical protein
MEYCAKSKLHRGSGLEVLKGRPKGMFSDAEVLPSASICYLLSAICY